MALPRRAWLRAVVALVVMLTAVTGAPGADHEVLQVRGPHVDKQLLGPSMEIARTNKRQASYPAYNKGCFSCTLGGIRSSSYGGSSSYSSASYRGAAGPEVTGPIGVPITTSTRQEVRSEQQFINGQPVYQLQHDRRFEDGRLVHDQKVEKGDHDLGFSDETGVGSSGSQLSSIGSGSSYTQGRGSYNTQPNNDDLLEGSYVQGSSFGSSGLGSADAQSDEYSSDFHSEMARMRENLRRQMTSYGSHQPVYGGSHRSEVHSETRYVNGQPVYVKNFERKYKDGQLVHNRTEEKGPEDLGTKDIISQYDSTGALIDNGVHDGYYENHGESTSTHRDNQDTYPRYRPGYASYSQYSHQHSASNPSYIPASSVQYSQESRESSSSSSYPSYRPSSASSSTQYSELSRDSSSSSSNPSYRPSSGSSSTRYSDLTGDSSSYPSYRPASESSTTQYTEQSRDSSSYRPTSYSSSSYPSYRPTSGSSTQYTDESRPSSSLYPSYRPAPGSSTQYTEHTRETSDSSSLHRPAGGNSYSSYRPAPGSSTQYTEHTRETSDSSSLHRPAGVSSYPSSRPALGSSSEQPSEDSQKYIYSYPTYAPSSGGSSTSDSSPHTGARQTRPASSVRGSTTVAGGTLVQQNVRHPKPDQSIKQISQESSETSHRIESTGSYRRPYVSSRSSGYSENQVETSEEQYRENSRGREVPSSSSLVVPSAPRTSGGARTTTFVLSPSVPQTPLTDQLLGPSHSGLRHDTRETDLHSQHKSQPQVGIPGAIIGPVVNDEDDDDDNKERYDISPLEDSYLPDIPDVDNEAESSFVPTIATVNSEAESGLIIHPHDETYNTLDESSTHHRTRVDGSSTLHRTHVDGSSTLHRTRVDGSSTLHRMRVDGSPTHHHTPVDGSSTRYRTPVDGSSTIHRTPVDGSPIFHRTPVDGSPTLHRTRVDGSPTHHRTPVDGSPTIHRTPVDGSPTLHRTPVDGSPTLHRTPADGSPTIHRTPVDGSPTLHRTPVDGSPTIHRTPVDGSPTLHQRGPYSGSSSSSYYYNSTHTRQGNLIHQVAPRIGETHSHYSGASVADETRNTYPLSAGSSSYHYNESRRHSSVIGGQHPAEQPGSLSDTSSSSATSATPCTQAMGCVVVGSPQSGSRRTEVRTTKKYINGHLVGLTHHELQYKNGELIHENKTEHGSDELEGMDLSAYGDDQLELVHGSYHPGSYSQQHELKQEKKFVNGQQVYDLHHERRFEDGHLVHENRTEKDEDELEELNAGHLGVSYLDNDVDTGARHEVTQTQHLQQHVTSGRVTEGGVGRSSQTHQVSGTGRMTVVPHFSSRRYEERRQQEYVDGHPVYDLHHERRFHNGSLVYENRTELDEKDLGVPHHDALHNILAGNTLNTPSQSSYGRNTDSTGVGSYGTYSGSLESSHSGGSRSSSSASGILKTYGSSGSIRGSTSSTGEGHIGATTNVLGVSTPRRTGSGSLRSGSAAHETGSHESSSTYGLESSSITGSSRHRTSSGVGSSGCLTCILLAGSGISGHVPSHRASHGYSGAVSGGVGGGFSERKEMNVEEHYEDGQLVHGREDSRRFRDGQLVLENRREYSDGSSQVSYPTLKSGKTFATSLSSSSEGSEGSGAGVCEPDPCQNGGTCLAGLHGPICACNFGFRGLECGELHCPKGFCRRGGKCNIEDGVHECTCRSGFSGYRCETRSKRHTRRLTRRHASHP